jgi:uncharacterized protein (TIGR00369 family)
MKDKAKRDTPPIRAPGRGKGRGRGGASGPSAHAGDVAPRPGIGRPSRFRGLVGYRAIAWRQGYAEIELALRAEHTNSLGVVHGGVYMTILDAAMGHAVSWCPVEGHARYSVTMSMTTSFLASASGGRIVAIGRLEAIHDRIATASAEARDSDGALLAVAQASFRYARGSERIEGVPRRAEKGERTA